MSQAKPVIVGDETGKLFNFDIKYRWHAPIMVPHI